MTNRARKGASLIQGMKAAKAAAASKPAPAAAPRGGDAQAPPKATGGEWKTTAIHLKKDQWVLLRDVARRRADEAENRPSVSDIIRDMIERQRDELEAELR